MEETKSVSDMRMLQLLFEPTKPYPAKSRVCVSGCYGEGKNGQPLLTPECVNPTELIVWIDDLRKELDVIKIEVQRKYAAYEKRRWTN